MFSHFRSGWQVGGRRGSARRNTDRSITPGAASPSPHLYPKWHLSPRKSVLIPQRNWPHGPRESQEALARWKMNGSNDELNTLARLETIFRASI